MWWGFQSLVLARDLYLPPYISPNTALRRHCVLILYIYRQYAINERQSCPDIEARSNAECHHGTVVCVSGARGAPSQYLSAIFQSKEGTLSTTLLTVRLGGQFQSHNWPSLPSLEVPFSKYYMQPIVF